MPTITYPGPDQISPPVAIGQGRFLAFPKDKPVEVTEEIAELVWQQCQQSGEFIVERENAPVPVTKKVKTPITQD